MYVFVFLDRIVNRDLEVSLSIEIMCSIRPQVGIEHGLLQGTSPTWLAH